MSEYYIRNKNQGYLGNAPFWWALAGGYTAAPPTMEFI